MGRGGRAVLRRSSFVSEDKRVTQVRNSYHRSLKFDQLGASKDRRDLMTWNTPVLVELCIGLEINGYLPAEF
jgi:hypothetical protein